MAIVLALKKVLECMNLFSDSLYAVNLLPDLVWSHIQLDNNSITPLMIQVHSLLKERKNPISIHHLRRHQNLPGLLAQGNALADQLASGNARVLTLQQSQNFHNLTHNNWRGLHARFPGVLIEELKRIIHSCKFYQPFLQLPPPLAASWGQPPGD